MMRPRVLAAVLATSIAMAATPALAEEDENLFMRALGVVSPVWTGMVDIALLRPLGAVIDRSTVGEHRRRTTLAKELPELERLLEASARL